MIPCLHPTTSGSPLELEEYLAIGRQAGFKMADLDASQVLQLEQSKGRPYVQELFLRHQIQWASFTLPVNLSANQSEQGEQWDRLVLFAETAKRYGVTRCVTWLWPSIDESPVPYACRLIRNVRQSADILVKEGIHLGLEFVGPHHLRNKRYPFVYTIPDLLLLIDAVARDNVGVLLDSYHWYTTGQSVQELALIPLEKLVHVHLNDTLNSPEEAHDQERLLPGDGMIDLTGFLRGIQAKGYTGPLSIEVLRKQAPAEAPDVIIKHAFSLVESLLAKL